MGDEDPLVALLEEEKNLWGYIPEKVDSALLRLLNVCGRGHRDVVRACRMRVTTETGSLQARALRALGFLAAEGDEEAIPTVLPWLTSTRQVDVRCAAADALAELAILCDEYAVPRWSAPEIKKLFKERLPQESIYQMDERPVHFALLHAIERLDARIAGDHKPPAIIEMEERVHQHELMELERAKHIAMKALCEGGDDKENEIATSSKSLEEMRRLEIVGEHETFKTPDGNVIELKDAKAQDRIDRDAATSTITSTTAISVARAAKKPSPSNHRGPPFLRTVLD